jgi:hypothetical protein
MTTTTKLSALTLVAATVLGATALAPASASARGRMGAASRDRTIDNTPHTTDEGDLQRAVSLQLSRSRLEGLTHRVLPAGRTPTAPIKSSLAALRTRRGPQERREYHMLFRDSIGAAALTVALLIGTTAQAFDDAKYPNLKGQWHRAEGNAGAGRFDPTKPPGRLQEVPLTAEYQAIYEGNLADKEAGGQGSDPTYKCLPPGMPRIMHAYAPMEVVVMPDTTYILMEHIHDNRRIHTDGRDFPDDMDADPMFAGYSIGRWVDEDGDGRYDVLLGVGFPTLL